MSDYTDLMVDCETFSTRYDAAIAQIAAIKFNRHHDDRELFENIFANGREDLLDPDRFFNIPIVPDMGHIDPDTVMWWLKQTELARKAIYEATLGEADALTQFANWIGSTRGMKIWANSPSADCVWLDTAHGRHGMSTPWDFKSEHDVRTVKTLARDISGKSIKNWKLEGSHNALIDCCKQIYQVQESFRLLRTA